MLSFTLAVVMSVWNLLESVGDMYYFSNTFRMLVCNCLKLVKIFWYKKKNFWYKNISMILQISEIWLSCVCEILCPRQHQSTKKIRSRSQYFCLCCYLKGYNKWSMHAKYEVSLYLSPFKNWKKTQGCPICRIVAHSCDRRVKTCDKRFSSFTSFSTVGQSETVRVYV